MKESPFNLVIYFVVALVIFLVFGVVIVLFTEFEFRDLFPRGACWRLSV